MHQHHWDQKDTHLEPRWRKGWFFYFFITRALLILSFMNKVKEWTSIAMWNPGQVVCGCSSERTSTLGWRFHLAS